LGLRGLLMAVGWLGTAKNGRRDVWVAGGREVLDGDRAGWALLLLELLLLLLLLEQQLG
jgi:hypothetical protein